MRILLATDNYPPIIGGAQIQSRVLAQGLRARGHSVAVATVWQHGVPARENDDGVDVFRLRQLRTLPFLARKWRHHQPPFPDPVTILSLRRVVLDFRPDVVDSYGWISYSCSAALAGIDVPLVITARDYAPSCATRTLLHNGRLENGQPCSGPRLSKCFGCSVHTYGRPKGWIAALGVRLSARMLARRVDAVHSISTYVEQIMRRDFVPGARGGAARDSVVHATVHDVVAGLTSQANTDESASSAVLARLDELPREPFILFVGGLRRVKGLEQLFEAYARLNDAPPLVLIGTIEPDSPAFPHSVRILKDFPHDAVMAAWERCSFAVLPSLLPEPFGTVVCEAMSRGKAVIGTYPGGHADMIVDGESGLLVPVGDVEALAEAMERLLVDDDLRERLGRNARERAQLFTLERSIPRFEQLCEDVIARSGRTS